MPAFRILNQFPVFFGLSGQLAAGAELRFYDAGTTDPKSVYGSKALSPDNGSVIAIGSDGRTEVDIWGDGSYRVRLYGADGTLIDEADDVEIAGGDAATIPTLVDGYFLTNNGALLLWAEVLQLPDPTGQDGKVPVADGEGYVLQPFPEAPDPVDPEIVVGANSFRAGVSSDATKFFIQKGSDTAPASGSVSTTKSVTFPTAFSTTPVIMLNVTSQSQPTGPTVAEQTSKSATGFTYRFDVAEADGGGQTMVNPVPFDWVAFGTIEVP